jgi:hypothetical protein
MAGSSRAHSACTDDDDYFSVRGLLHWAVLISQVPATDLGAAQLRAASVGLDPAAECEFDAHGRRVRLTAG